MANHKVTYADGSTDILAFDGPSDELFEQLFSACSDEVRENCSVDEEKVKHTPAPLVKKK